MLKLAMNVNARELHYEDTANGDAPQVTTRRIRIDA